MIRKSVVFEQCPDAEIGSKARVQIALNGWEVLYNIKCN